MKIIIAGGTGLVGQNLIPALISAGHTLFLLSRRAAQKNIFPLDRVQTLYWDGKNLGDWARCFEGADAVINLCGEGIADKRWSSQQKEKLRSSRLDSTRLIVKAIKQSSVKPKVLVNASAVGFYGSVAEGEVEESRGHGQGFLADLCVDWEKAALEAEELGVRVVLPRIGIVLDPKQGALAKMIPPFRWGVGGFLGSGKQWFPWVHIDDLVGMILFAISHEGSRGPFNACAPNPVRMKDFCASLGKVLDRPSCLPVPGFLLRFLLGEMASMLLGGQRAVPRKMLQSGFRFRYPVLESSLVSLIGHPL
ncbi:MAG TPA: TIGR01777 family oxidoreductase [Candidatus Omnitrophota bacterium]|nr:TIGR01777 family oxidoreductase [Candidatus Omnitrophota bacterium]